jgi:hypothetical protein
VHVVAVFTHPVAGTQESVVQRLLSSQFTAAPAQDPPEQASPVVQALLSSQDTVLLVCAQIPPLQVSVVQALPSSQFAGVQTACMLKLGP